MRIKNRTVTCVIRCRSRILLLKRSPIVSTNPNRWSAVTGRLEENQSLEALAYQEILEETGLNRRQVRLVRRGTAYRLRIGLGIESLVQPFLFESATRRIKLNWEHTESKWIKLTDLRTFRLIPRFDLSLKALGLT